MEKISEYYWFSEVPKWLHYYGTVTVMNKTDRAGWIDYEYNKADDATKTQLRLN